MRRAESRPPRLRLIAALVAALAVLAGCSAVPAGSGQQAPADEASPQQHADEDDLDPGGDAPSTPSEDADGAAPESTSPSHAPVARAEEIDERDRELAADLRALVAAADEALGDERLSVRVADARGADLASLRAQRARLPASTQKLATAASALELLPADARLPTEAGLTGPVDDDGVLRGDLLLVGHGDPALSTAAYRRLVYPARPHTAIEGLARQIVDAGIERVRGSVVGTVADGFGAGGLAEGWPERYLDTLDARPIAALTVNGGLDLLPPRGSDGQEASEDEPPEPPTRDDDLEPVAVAPGLEARDLAPGAAVRARPARPGRAAAVALHRALTAEGVRIDGGAVDATDTELADLRPLGRLGAVESPPLDELLGFMVRRSDNHIADTLLPVLGRQASGDGTIAGGAAAVSATLQRLGVASDGLRVADGSGLSRADRLSADALVALDRTMLAGPSAQRWTRLLPEAGRDGTLRGRWRDTAAEGHLRAKTGTLRDTRALAGHVTGEAGRWHFAVVANDLESGQRATVRALTDELGLRLAAHARGCSLDEREPEPPDGDDEPPLPGRPALAIAC